MAKPGKLQTILSVAACKGARAILRRAPILLLDEATSALDAETEAQVMENVVRDDPKKIVILTTHKQSVLTHCTRFCTVTADGEMIPHEARPAAHTIEEKD